MQKLKIFTSFHKQLLSRQCSSCLLIEVLPVSGFISVETPYCILLLLLLHNSLRTRFKKKRAPSLSPTCNAIHASFMQSLISNVDRLLSHPIILVALSVVTLALPFATVILMIGVVFRSNLLSPICAEVQTEDSALSTGCLIISVVASLPSC